MTWGRSAPLRRSPFKSNARSVQVVERLPRALPTVVPGLFRLPVRILMPALPVIKEVRVRDEAYKRLVASRPCINCGIQGQSQAAHENHGKGMSMKVCDLRTFPLCTVAGNDCHGRFDQYRLFKGRAVHILAGSRWARETALAIWAEGTWPVKHTFPYDGDKA